MIKAIIFDWGGVLMRTEDHSGRRKWDKDLNKPHGYVEGVVHGSESWKMAQSGQISEEEYWNDVARQLGIQDKERLQEFRKDYFNGDRLDNSLIRLIKRLKSKFKIALLSNDILSLSDKLRENELTSVFDIIVISAEEFKMKPDPEIYETILKKLEVEAHEAIFIDDSEDNIVGALDKGIQAVLFNVKSLNNLKTRLENLLETSN